MFSLSCQHKPPFVNPVTTRLTKVKDIPYFVSDKFLRTYYRDRYQLAQVERMVERSYETFLTDQCKKQKEYKNRLFLDARKESDAAEKIKKEKLAEEFQPRRCEELGNLFPQKAR